MYIGMCYASENKAHYVLYTAQTLKKDLHTYVHEWPQIESSRLSMR
jgi:hypothetical protein